MKNLFYTLSTLCLILCTTLKMSAQGCSDAGICSIKSIQEPNDKQSKWHYQLGQSLALGEQQILHSLTTMQIQWRFKNYHLQFTAPYLVNVYKGEVNHGPGDLTILNQYQIHHHWAGAIGLKTPLNKGNHNDAQGHTLPMAMQTSLGTFDLLMMLSYRFQKWNMNVGWQHPITQNGNTFEANDKYPNFITTKDFIRGDDLMLSLNWSHRQKWQFSAISVYRIKGDQSEGEVIAGSEGLSINLNAKYTKKLNNKLKLNLMAAAPILVRKVRPDGTTRSFIIGVSLNGFF